MATPADRSADSAGFRQRPPHPDALKPVFVGPDQARLAIEALVRNKVGDKTEITDLDKAEIQEAVAAMVAELQALHAALAATEDADTDWALADLESGFPQIATELKSGASADSVVHTAMAVAVEVGCRSRATRALRRGAHARPLGLRTRSRERRPAARRRATTGSSTSSADPPPAEEPELAPPARPLIARARRPLYVFRPSEARS